MNESQRIELFLKHKGLKKNSLAKSLGYKNGTVFYHINSGRNGISADLAKRIAEVYPEVNQNWFLTGKGKMLLSDDTETNEKLVEKIYFLERHIKGQDSRIQLLEQEIASLKNP